ncbi:MAG: hypothetical protein BGO82_19410 [Devosia sp. 67-54]|uniref:GNAT family N-acetyltransferase n=1 Tax=unclassified Devosia TaxID=196773 RepID=UPI000963C410|nr:MULTISPECIES: GNAT family N-acetyltransferase [unclassified Devosia]MBN9306261.1 GNAT family N-acetyltransferase [Devosia sp.]OJX18335.1 MAG: hypothetical protein BGO82_19410 [Devosia sp. 67-54]
MSRLDIRIAHPDDRLNLIDLQRRASLAAEEGEMRQRLLDEPGLIDLDEEMLANNEVVVAQIGDRIVGFATIVAHDGNDAELEGLFVEPTHWRQGIGTALLHAIEREAAAWGASRLHVLANARAMPFYEAMGFVRVGERKTPLGPVAPLLAKPVVPR